MHEVVHLVLQARAYASVRRISGKHGAHWLRVILPQPCYKASTPMAPVQLSSTFLAPPSMQTFEYVLDYLRAVRCGERDSCLPQDERALCLLRREAEFYQLPHLAERAGAELRRLQAAGKRGGGRGLPQVLGGPGSPTCDDCKAASGGGDGEAEVRRRACSLLGSEVGDKRTAGGALSAHSPATNARPCRHSFRLQVTPLFPSRLPTRLAGQPQGDAGCGVPGDRPAARWQRGVSAGGAPAEAKLLGGWLGGRVVGAWALGLEVSTAAACSTLRGKDWLRGSMLCCMLASASPATVKAPAPHLPY